MNAIANKSKNRALTSIEKYARIVEFNQLRRGTKLAFAFRSTYCTFSKINVWMKQSTQMSEHVCKLWTLWMRSKFKDLILSHLFAPEHTLFWFLFSSFVCVCFFSFLSSVKHNLLGFVLVESFAIIIPYYTPSNRVESSVCMYSLHEHTPSPHNHK